MAFEAMKAFFARWVPEINKEVEAFFKEKEKTVGEYGEINRTLLLDFSKNFILGGGKRVRPMLTLLGYKGVTGEINEPAVQTGALVEILHAFLLIHDDICDRDPFRRGNPTLWKSIYDYLSERGFGDALHHANSLAMITGDVVYTYTYQLVSRISTNQRIRNAILRKISDITEKTGYGQNLDVFLSVIPLKEIGEEDVLKVYRLKTGIYSVAGPLELGAILAEAEESIFKTYRAYGEKAGIAFQIHDDIIGVFGDPKTTGKPVGSDIREGKRTILVVKAYQNASKTERKLLAYVLGKQDAPQELIEEAADIIRSSGALDYAKELEKKLAEEAKAILRDADIEGETKEILLEFTDYVMMREK